MSETAAVADQPVVRKPVQRKSELDTRSVKTPQKAPLRMPPIGEDVVREPDRILPVDKPMTKSEFDALAFAEEPVMILIHRSTEKFSARCTDFIAINGTKGEMLFKNGWVQMGYFPRGVPVVTKRKYIEVLARARNESIATQVIEHDNEDPQNNVERNVTHIASFSVLEDKNPLGAEWLVRLLTQG